MTDDQVAPWFVILGAAKDLARKENRFRGYRKPETNSCRAALNSSVFSS